MPVPDFLRTDEQIEAPIGVGFGPMSLIARWGANVYFSFWSDMEFPKDEYGWEEIRETRAGSFWYYFRSRAKADVAYAETGGGYGPSATWMWAAKTDTVLNWRGDNAIEDAFGPIVWRESAYRTMSKAAHKSRHELHMISLPAAVAAMADCYGYDNPGFSLDELMRPDDEILWTDDFQRDMVGNRDVGYTESKLWRRWAELCKALGEPDASKWQPMGSGVAGGKYDTTSEKLHNCLAILHSPWKAPIWARVTFVWDPRVDAVFGDDQRLTRPVLVKIFSSQAEAQAAATEETGTEPTVASMHPSTSAASTGEPALPSGYGEFHNEWIEAVQDLKKEHREGLPPPPVLVKELKRLLPDHGAGEAYQIVKAWWPVV